MIDPELNHAQELARQQRSLHARLQRRQRRRLVRPVLPHPLIDEPRRRSHRRIGFSIQAARAEAIVGESASSPASVRCGVLQPRGSHEHVDGNPDLGAP
jgi:hypothetical protein